jgi:hypothetical protein
MPLASFTAFCIVVMKYGIKQYTFISIRQIILG